MPLEYTQVIASAAALYLLYLFVAITKPSRDREPPGPRPLPIIGNLFDINFARDRSWEIFTRWKEQYGDIVSINMLGTRIVVLNSISTATDLLEKRSAKYSGRPRSVMLRELVGLDYAFNIMDYSPRWRKHRRLFHQYFNENEVVKYKSIQQRYVHPFLQRLFAEPENFLSHVRLLFGETILDVVYDIKAEDNNAAFIQIAEKVMTPVQDAGIPGQFLVDVIPTLMHVPFWFPGAKFKHLAASWRKVVNDLKILPFACAKKKMEEGYAGPSVLASMLERCDEGPKEGTRTKESQEDVAKGCAAMAYLGGADTTLSIIQAFFMVMANNQDVQRAAQKELDSLSDDAPIRLPIFEDKDQLPYVTAIIKEMLRYHNVLPIGAPHMLTEDDEYNGYILRKGTVVFTNVWHILRDPTIYPDPFAFNPRRWLIDTPNGLEINTSVPDPDITFGAGRRICPGRYYASNSLFITLASVLACFDIRPLNSQGQKTDHVDEEFTNGLLIYPVPYRVSIGPRSNEWAQLIRDLDTDVTA